MRWGERSARPGALVWVRPLHAIIATFGPETEVPDIVPFTVDGIAAGDMTHGHRFMAPRAFHVRRFEDYAAKLGKAKVVLDPERRRDIILTDARQLAFAQGLDLVEDAALLDEVAGLVEWPVVLMGTFDADFLKMPPEVIRTTIRANQKCFVVRSLQPSPAGGGSLASERGGAGAQSAARRVRNTCPHPPPPFPPRQRGRVGEGATSPLQGEVKQAARWPTSSSSLPISRRRMAGPRSSPAMSA